MLDDKQLKIINEELKKSSASEFAEVLLAGYCSGNINGVKHLLALIPRIAMSGFEDNQQKIEDFACATDFVAVRKI
jgi:hypothetical protein